MQTSRLNNRWYVHDISDCKVLLEVNSTVLTFSFGTLFGASMVEEQVMNVELRCVSLHVDSDSEV